MHAQPLDAVCQNLDWSSLTCFCAKRAAMVCLGRMLAFPSSPTVARVLPHLMSHTTLQCARYVAASLAADHDGNAPLHSAETLCSSLTVWVKGKSSQGAQLKLTTHCHHLLHLIFRTHVPTAGGLRAVLWAATRCVVMPAVFVCEQLAMAGVAWPSVTCVAVLSACVRSQGT
jgi:hypothetical protein